MRNLQHTKILEPRIELARANVPIGKGGYSDSTYLKRKTLYSPCVTHRMLLQRVLTPRFRTLRRGPFSTTQRHLRPNSTVRSGPTMPRPEVVFADPHAAPRSSNKHVSVNPEGIELVDLEFVEEPLGVTAEQGHGYLWIEFGDVIGPDGRYKIIRKLGWGMNASIWMAFDEKYVLSDRQSYR